jgi:cell division transport system permease protein
MMLIRAIAYFVQEALQSLWRSRLINSLSVLTIAVSLFVLGAFLSVASVLGGVVDRWTQKVQVTFYLDGTIEARNREALEQRLREDPAVLTEEFVSRQEAVGRFQHLFKDLAALPEDLGENPFPASIEVTLRGTHQSRTDVERLVRDHGHAPGVQEVNYDVIWIERLAAAARVIRGVGFFLGGILVLAGVFTISNVIRLTVYAREDELDIMRLVGATPSYIKGPFLVEGMLQGALGGLAAVALLHTALLAFARDVAAASDLVGRASAGLPPGLALVLVVGGMVAGLAGSLVSLGRLRI